MDELGNFPRAIHEPGVDNTKRGGLHMKGQVTQRACGLEIFRHKRAGSGCAAVAAIEWETDEPLLSLY